jgi:hypothetical protein
MQDGRCLQVRPRRRSVGRNTPLSDSEIEGCEPNVGATKVHSPALPDTRHPTFLPDCFALPVKGKLDRAAIDPTLIENSTPS